MRALLGGQVTLVSALICAHFTLTSLCPTGEGWSDPPAALATAPLGAAWGGALEVTWGRPPRASLPITWYQVWAHGDHVASVNATAPGDGSGSERLRVELSGLELNTTYYIEVFPVSVSGDCLSQGPAASINVTLASSRRVDSRGLLNCNTTCLSEDARTALIVVPLVIGVPTVVLVAVVLWKGCSRWDPPGTRGDDAQLKHAQGPPRTPARPGTLGGAACEQTRATWTPPDKAAG